MSVSLVILIVGIFIIAVYDFTNGFHDAADMIATAIASRVMPVKAAISIVVLFTFLGPLLGGVAVADTIGQVVNIDPHAKATAQSVVMAAILAAVSYNLITWKLGLPSSSSSSLTSGLVGAGLYAVGSHHIHWGVHELLSFKIAGFMKIVFGMFFSPLAGFLMGVLIIKILRKAFSRLTIRAKPFLIISQYLTVSWLAFSHGTNDAQKGMGMIAMMLYASGVFTHFHVPWWVIMISASSITLGTLFGGWSIIKTVGFGIYRVRLIHSLADQVGSAAVILGSSLFGAPTSTTQVVTTTLIGVGAGERPGHVRWQKAKSIVKGWALNIPVSIGMGYLFCTVLLHFMK